MRELGYMLWGLSKYLQKRREFTEVQLAGVFRSSIRSSKSIEKFYYINKREKISEIVQGNNLARILIPQMHHYLLTFILLCGDYLPLLHPKMMLESVSNLECYKSHFPPAKVQRRAMFLFLREQFAQENTYSNEKACSWGLF